MIGQTSPVPELVSEVVRSVKPEVAAARELLAKPLEESRARPRRREINGQDEAALAWFFGQGLSIYEKSTFGPIVEKIAMDGFSSTTCGRCEGAGILEDGGIRLEDKCTGCHGSGLAPHKAGEKRGWCLTCDGHGRVPSYEVEMEHGGWCPACRGTGTGSIERRAMRRARCCWCRPEPSVLVTDERTGETVKERVSTAWVPRHCCPNCLGTGDEPIAAKPIQKDDEGGGVLGNDVALTRFAITSRRADAVKAISPALHAALEAFYGDVGHRWANSGFGRMFALFHLTSAGKRLARMGVESPGQKLTGKTKKKKALKYQQLITAAIAVGARGEADRLAKEKEQATLRAAAPPLRDDELAAVELNVQERIGVQANVQKSQPTDKRRDLLALAQVQAEELYRRAAQTWNGVATPKAAREAIKRLDANLRRLGHSGVADFVTKQAGGSR